MKSLSEVKKYLSEKYGVAASAVAPFSAVFAENEIQEFMLQNADTILELAEKIGKGVNFREYFEDLDKLRELRDMRYSDPESFFDIIRKEELFLNHVLKMSGHSNAIVSFNLDAMFKDLDDE